MRGFTILGAGLAAASAAGALAASPVSAAPPGWWACVKATPKNTGLFSDKACTTGVESGGKYEVRPGVGKAKPFKTHGREGQAILWMNIPGTGEPKLECEQTKISGKAAPPNREVGVRLSFSKCRLLGSPCQDITTAPLSGELGWLNEEKGEVGIALSNEAAPGSGYILQFECPGVAKGRIHGSFIGEQRGDVQKLSSTASMRYELGQYLGEGSPPGYNPLTNPPAFEEGEPVGVMLVEFNDQETGNTWGPEGGLPMGLQALGGTGTNEGVNTAGETLMIR
jgi:hypothetical protein